LTGFPPFPILGRYSIRRYTCPADASENEKKSPLISERRNSGKTGTRRKTADFSGLSSGIHG
jgi:hypothetical protein